MSEISKSLTALPPPSPAIPSPPLVIPWEPGADLRKSEHAAASKLQAAVKALLVRRQMEEARKRKRPPGPGPTLQNGWEWVVGFDWLHGVMV